jgi:hypothetical protein
MGIEPLQFFGPAKRIIGPPVYIVNTLAEAFCVGTGFFLVTFSMQAAYISNPHWREKRKVLAIWANSA